MRVLLDTHIILWALNDDPRLSAARREILSDPGVERVVSAASLWEISIKRALGKLEAPDDLADTLRATGCTPLMISWAHGERAGALPPHHADPFDRLLIAQAQIEGVPLMTSDQRILAYEVETVG